MPANVQVPELRAVAPFGIGFLIGRARILGQALLDQLHHRLIQTQCLAAGLGEGAFTPVHLDQFGRFCRHLVARFGQRIGVGHIGFDVDDRRAVQQIDARNEQASRFDPVEPDHRLADTVRPMRRARGEYADHAVAAQARRSNPQTRLVLQRLMEQEQQPDMADLLQPRDRLAAVEWRQQFQHATGGRSQVRLTRNGELLPEAGAQIADRLDVMGHGGCRFEVGLGSDVAIIPDGAARKGADPLHFPMPVGKPTGISGVAFRSLRPRGRIRPNG